jgi:hypothetical protein
MKYASLGTEGDPNVVWMTVPAVGACFVAQHKP